MAFLPAPLGYVGVGIAGVLVAMLALCIAQDLFTLGMGLVLLVLAMSFITGSWWWLLLLRLAAKPTVDGAVLY